MFIANDKEKEDLEKLAEQEQKLPAEIEEKKRKGTLRTGYTTGTTATAATKGALHALITGRPTEQVTVSLPKDRTVNAQDCLDKEPKRRQGHLRSDKRRWR